MISLNLLGRMFAVLDERMPGAEGFEVHDATMESLRHEYRRISVALGDTESYSSITRNIRLTE
ncbi:hypothetical protein K458DRAFT_422689 [Lentithecium fluviatile CBS 122367]|uniref:Uncharacterized protein n=1 Tax=Lentithecium fluviatile CBS 122367 TaxID=1168545 RepID=A0A6G1IMC5_9PLEO|nr:hypothetical protein K458DRAFT_422689 [Lentithecium fluviatile CBS 122367]